MNATLLADGSVLVTGGTSGPGSTIRRARSARRALESPDRDLDHHGLRRAARPDVSRDGAAVAERPGALERQWRRWWDHLCEQRVLGAVFTPPYLFNADGTPAARPSITSAPSTLSYGQSFTVQTPDAGSITRGTLIRLSSVTHAFNMSQLIYPLTFAAASAHDGECDSPAECQPGAAGTLHALLDQWLGCPFGGEDRNRRPLDGGERGLWTQLLIHLEGLASNPGILLQLLSAVRVPPATEGGDPLSTASRVACGH